MFKRHLAAALAALLTVGACAPCACAQSGRRLPRSAGDEGLVVSAGEKADVPERMAEGTQGGDFVLRGLNAGRTAPVVYAEDGGKHPNKADKIAGAALLGYLIFFVVVTLSKERAAPSGGTAPYAGLRR